MNEPILLLLTGGASILVWMATFLLVSKSAEVVTVSIFMWWLALAVNHPHFLGSYTLLYSDFRREILKKPGHFWAAVIVPCALLGYFGYALTHQREDLIGYSINLMFFLVGWHYVKQIFGCVIVGAVRQGQIYKRIERWAILLNLFCLWWITLIRGPYAATTLNYHGIPYSSPVHSDFDFLVAFICLALSGLLVIAVHLQRYLKTGVLPSMMGTVAMASIYLWFFPGFKHPVFDYSIPFFHSLQYLALAGQFKFNQVAAQLGPAEGEARRKLWLRKFAGYWFVVFLLGLVGFVGLPGGLDALGLLPWDHQLGPTPFTAMIIVFINVHHYFIDNVIWRASNPEIRKYLFKSDRPHVRSMEPVRAPASAAVDIPLPAGAQPAH